MADNGSTQWGPWTINDVAYRLLGSHKYEQWFGAMRRISREIEDEADPHKRYRELRSYSERVIEIEFLGRLITEKYVVTSIRDGVVTPVPLSEIPIPSIHISLFTDLIVAASATAIEEWPFVSIYTPALALSQSVPQPALQVQFDEELRRRRKEGPKPKNGYHDPMMQYAKRVLDVRPKQAEVLWKKRSEEFSRKGGALKKLG